MKLNRNDFYMQECRKCNNDSCKISNYTPLELSEDGIHHERSLCAKCQHGEICHETGTYYGIR